MAGARSPGRPIDLAERSACPPDRDAWTSTDDRTRRLDADADHRRPTPPPSPRPTSDAAVPAAGSAQDDVPITPSPGPTPERVARALEHARICARIADDNRGKDILLLDLRKATPLVDFFVIATAASRRQSHAIADEIDQEMKKLGEHKLGMEGSEEGRWILIDYGDFVVHVFSTEAPDVLRPRRDLGRRRPQLDWHDPDRPAPPARPSEPDADAGRRSGGIRARAEPDD